MQSGTDWDLIKLEPNNWKTVLELNRVKNLPRQIPRWRLSNRVEIKELSIPLATSMLWTIWWSLHWSKIPGLTSLNQRPKSQANTLFKCFTKRSIFPFTAEFFYFPLILHLDFLNAENEGIMSLEFLQLINNPKTFPSPFSTYSKLNLSMKWNCVSRNFEGVLCHCFWRQKRFKAVIFCC